MLKKFNIQTITNDIQSRFANLAVNNLANKYSNPNFQSNNLFNTAGQSYFNPNKPQSST